MDNLFLTGDDPFNDEYYLYSRKIFMKGETILMETPLLSTQFSWNLAQSFSACEHCLRPIENAEETVSRLLGEPNKKLPFMNECCDTNKAIQMLCNCGQIYCSYYCQENAWNSYHSLLCPTSDDVPDDLKKNIKNLTELWRDINPFSINDESFIYFLLKYLAIHKQNGNRPDEWPVVHNFSIMKSQYFDRNMLQLNNRHLEHIRHLLRRIFNDDELISRLSSRKQISQIFKVLILMNRNVKTSALERWEENVDRLMYDKNPKDRHNMAEQLGVINSRIHYLNGNRRFCEGMAIYSSMTMFAHSCQPNAIVEFPENNHKIVVKALRPISAAEKITLNFCSHIDAWDNFSPSARKCLLLERYYIQCDCRICRPDLIGSLSDEEDDDLDDEDDDEDEDEDDGTYDEQRHVMNDLHERIDIANGDGSNIFFQNGQQQFDNIQDEIDSVRNAVKRNQDEIADDDDDDYDDRISASESSEDDATIVDESQSG